ncbi:MurR/RpiR family transcriptional regulator [Oceanobacillus locisalsi]|uniref:MurR/RpiR family transcriptional regulator n=1 Tax=Oceanobacillus locisalsi TaxID=546107 RepID=A0ABW3NIK6_9BACI
MNIQDLILKYYNDLSKGHRKVADYLLENTLEFSVSTVEEIAKEVSTSKATVIRLSYALGFGSFSSMQKSLKAQLLNEDESPRQTENITDDDVNNLLSLTLNRDIFILEKLKENLDINRLNDVIKELADADEIKIAGYGASFSAAHWFYTKLSMIREDVTLLSSIISLNAPGDVLSREKDKVIYVLLSFPSYMSETLKLANIAKEKGAKIIVISDRLLSPVARIADICLTTDINVSSVNLVSMSSVHSLLNLIATGMEFDNKEVVTERLRKINEIYSKNEYFLE